YAQGPFRVAEWSHVTNCHLIPGPGIIAGLRQGAESARAGAAAKLPAGADQEAELARGLLLIAEMSSAGALATGSYTEASVAAAEAHAEFVMGFICQRKLSQLPGMLHLSPGCQLPPAGTASDSSRTGGDSLGQQYHSPRAIIGAQGSDMIIVGRGIC